jgi:hypothetical protein
MPTLFRRTAEVACVFLALPRRCAEEGDEHLLSPHEEKGVGCQ